MIGEIILGLTCIGLFLCFLWTYFLFIRERVYRNREWRYVYGQCEDLRAQRAQIETASLYWYEKCKAEMAAHLKTCDSVKKLQDELAWEKIVSDKNGRGQ